MRTRYLAAIIIIGFAIGASYGVVRAQQERPKATGAAARTHSVWNGVYTDEQAKRGEPLYRLRCASCHGDKMTR